jgi:hypothetical protein
LFGGRFISSVLSPGYLSLVFSRSGYRPLFGGRFISSVLSLGFIACYLSLVLAPRIYRLLFIARFIRLVIARWLAPVLDARFYRPLFNARFSRSQLIACFLQQPSDNGARSALGSNAVTGTATGVRPSRRFQSARPAAFRFPGNDRAGPSQFFQLRSCSAGAEVGCIRNAYGGARPKVGGLAMAACLRD